MWRWVFDSCRVPGADGKEWVVSSAREGDNGNDGHVIFLRKNCVWIVDVAQDGELISTDNLQSQIQYIYHNSITEAPAVGVLGTAHRDIWATNYSILRRDPRNARIVHMIESSAFIVCLDTERPDGKADLDRAAWHGGVEGRELGNRWIDKTSQFIVWDNGQAGYMGKHSVLDGSVTARMCYEVLDAINLPSFNHGKPSNSVRTVLPTRLDWGLDSNHPLVIAIDMAKRDAEESISSTILTRVSVNFGAPSIKMSGFSPDGFIQMIIQLAYHRLVGGRSGRRGGTYEAAMTRQFKKGAMDAAGRSVEERRTLFRNAILVRALSARDALMAQGIDRHLLGLQWMVSSNETQAEPFYDPVFVRASKWVVSTGVTARVGGHIDSFGFNAVEPDGFGLMCMCGVVQDCMTFTVTSRRDMPNEAFSRHLVNATEDILALFSAPGFPVAKL